MKLPHGDRAFVDAAKLRDYSLSQEHPRGRHKARVFAAALGLTASDAEELRQLLLANAAASDVQPTRSDEYGDRYVLDFDVARGGWTARVRRLPAPDHLLRSGLIVRVSVARQIKLLDVVALLQDLPEARLQRGQVGTVVETLTPDVFEVEFSDDRGQMYASVPVAASNLLPLVYEATEAAS